MSEEIKQPAYEDEIDLGAIFQTLWKARLLIVSLTLAAALAAYAVSAWLLPEQYQATAYIGVGQPTVSYRAEGLVLNITTPDIKVLPDAVRASFLLDQVAADPRVLAISGPNRKAFADQIEVSLLGNSQLRLRVDDTDPQRAALLANVWAEKASEWINENYGVSSSAQLLEDQMIQAKQILDQAQDRLEMFLLTDQTLIFSDRLIADQTLLSCVRQRTSNAQTIIAQLDNLREQTAQVESLRLADSVILASITREMAGLGACGDAVSLVEQLTPDVFLDLGQSEAEQVIAGLRQNLLIQVETSRAQQEALEKSILELQVQLEHAQAQRDQLIAERDQARAFYNDLSYLQTLFDTVLQQSGRVAWMSVTATAPDAPVASQSLMNSVLIGLAMAFIVSAWVLFRSFWNAQSSPLTK